MLGVVVIVLVCSGIIIGWIGLYVVLFRGRKIVEVVIFVIIEMVWVWWLFYVFFEGS